MLNVSELTLIYAFSFVRRYVVFPFRLLLAASPSHISYTTKIGHKNKIDRRNTITTIWIEFLFPRSSAFNVGIVKHVYPLFFSLLKRDRRKRRRWEQKIFGDWQFFSRSRAIFINFYFALINGSAAPDQKQTCDLLHWQIHIVLGNQDIEVEVPIYEHRTCIAWNMNKYIVFVVWHKI